MKWPYWFNTPFPCKPPAQPSLTACPTCGEEVSSRAEEFHLRALPEPCMNLSIHTAPDVRPLP
jgi:hypothetical protein